MIKLRLSMALSVLLGAGVAMSACSSGEVRGSGEDVASTQSAVVAGAMNVSGNVFADSSAESQTAAVGMGTSLAVAYNTAFAPVSEQRCPGLSQIAMSYLVPGHGWQGIHFATPSGIGALRADPSIGYVDAGANYQVFVSAIAYSSSEFSACTDYDSYASLPANRLCVMTVNVPKNGAAASVVGSSCFNNPTGSPSYRGTAVTVVSGVAYVASWNLSGPSGSRYEFFQVNGTQKTAPLATTSVSGYPIFVKGSPGSLIGPDSSGTFWMTSYLPSSNSWSTPLQMGSGFQGAWTLPYGILNLQRQYAAVFVPGTAGPGATHLVYRTGDQLVSMARSSSGSSGVTQEWISNPNFDSFQPSLEVAAIPNEFSPFTGFHPLLSYWETSGPNGSAALQHTWLGQNFGNWTTETPCVFKHYFGLYDEMAVQNNNTGMPRFWRFFTDSSAPSWDPTATCSPGEDWDRNVLQHVSAVVSSQTSCAHDPCREGGFLSSSCNSCVSSICAQDPYCCNNFWDVVCTGEVGSICGLGCE